MDEADPLDIRHSIRATQYCQVAACALVVYEHFNTFGLEVEVIWKKKWTVVQVFFIINRYLGNFLVIAWTVVYLFSPSPGWVKQCGTWHAVQGWAGMIVEWSVQGIMQCRISAMYNHSRRVMFVIAGFFVGEAVLVMVLYGFAHKSATFSTEPIPGVRICAETSIATYYHYIWVPMILYESLLFALALRAGSVWYRSARRAGATRLLSSRYRHSYTLWFLLLRDSIMFPFVTVSIYVGSLIVWKTLPTYWMEAPISLCVALYSVLGSRLILNLREAYYLPLDAELERPSVFDLDCHLDLQLEDEMSDRSMNCC